MPTLANITVNPEATIVDDRIRPDGLRETIVNVKGLLCFLWVNRVKNALEGLKDVKEVTFQEGKDHFTVVYQRDSSMKDEIMNKVLDTVVAPSMRETLSKLGKD